MEVHHRVGLDQGGEPYCQDNLMVLTRQEHIELHRREDETPRTGRVAGVCGRSD